MSAHASAKADVSFWLMFVGVNLRSFVRLTVYFSLLVLTFGTFTFLFDFSYIFVFVHCWHSWVNKYIFCTPILCHCMCFHFPDREAPYNSNIERIMDW